MFGGGVVFRGEREEEDDVCSEGSEIGSAIEIADADAEREEESLDERSRALMEEALKELTEAIREVETRSMMQEARKTEEKSLENFLGRVDLL